jgi:molecular chaperone GrpE (heat shock protein)
MTALLTVTTKLAYFMGAGGILFIGASVWWLWRSRKKIKSSCQVQPIATGTEIEAAPIPDKGALHPKIERADETIEEIADCPTLLSEIAGSCGDSGTRSFMDEIITRTREEASEFGDDTPLDFIEEIVDRIDDLKLLSAKASPEDASRIDQFSKQLKDLLKAAGVELLHSDSWEPDIQRALTKTPTEGISKPEIASFGSTGISRHRKLIRKQEVLLAVPSEPTT